MINGTATVKKQGVWYRNQPKIVIAPSEVLVDEPVAFTVEGCAPASLLL